MLITYYIYTYNHLATQLNKSGYRLYDTLYSKYPVVLALKHRKCAGEMLRKTVYT